MSGDRELVVVAVVVIVVVVVAVVVLSCRPLMTVASVLWDDNCHCRLVKSLFAGGLVNTGATCMTEARGGGFDPCQSTTLPRYTEVFTLWAVASLGLVSPCAVTGGVTFFSQKTDDLFSHYPSKVTAFQSSSCKGWSFVKCSCKFSRNKLTFIRVSAPCMASPGAVRPPAAPPSHSDATSCESD